MLTSLLAPVVAASGSAETLETASLALEAEQTAVEFTATLSAEFKAGVTVLGVASEDAVDDVTIRLLEKEETGDGDADDGAAGVTPPSPPADDGDAADDGDETSEEETAPASVEVGAVDVPDAVESVSDGRRPVRAVTYPRATRVSGGGWYRGQAHSTTRPRSSLPSSHGASATEMASRFPPEDQIRGSFVSVPSISAAVRP